MSFVCKFVLCGFFVCHVLLCGPSCVCLYSVCPLYVSLCSVGSLCVRFYYVVLRVCVCILYVLCV
jgi:hypothetical protein